MIEEKMLLMVVEPRVEEPETVRFVMLADESVVEPVTLRVPLSVMLLVAVKVPAIEVPWRVVDASVALEVAESVPIVEL